jgi:hypothetical protein
MWNDIVNANCARANTTASQPSNIAAIRRYGAGFTTLTAAMVLLRVQAGNPPLPAASMRLAVSIPQRQGEHRET